MQNDSLVKMKDQLEYLFVRIIIAGLKRESLPITQAKQLAHEFLSIEPFISAEDAHLKMDQFTVKYPQFKILQEYTDAYYDEDKIDDKINSIREKIKENKLDEALSIASS